MKAHPKVRLKSAADGVYVCWIDGFENKNTSTQRPVDTNTWEKQKR